MIDIDNKILKFINEHHVLTLATAVDNMPYCANCFYSYLKSENVFIFTSDDNTKHISDAKLNCNVAASIVLETNVIGKIRGLQITGKMFVPEGELMKSVSRKYLLRFPFAKLMNTKLWVLKPDFMKLTDNRLGFGTKLIWKDESKNQII